MTKQYYDKAKDVTVTVTAGKKRTKAQKKRYFQNRKSSLGQRQRQLMTDMSWIQSFSKRDPNLMPIDQRDMYLRAQEQQQTIQKQLLGITGMIQALNRNDPKEFTEIATQADLILPNDVLMLLDERSIIGEQIFDKASIKGTRLERLRKLANEGGSQFRTMFKSNVEDNQNYYTLNNNFRGIIPGQNITNIDRLYQAVLDNRTQLGIENLTYIREVETGYGPYEGITSEEIGELERVTTVAGSLATQPTPKPGEQVTVGIGPEATGTLIDPGLSRASSATTEGAVLSEASMSIQPPTVRRTASGRIQSLSRFIRPS